ACLPLTLLCATPVSQLSTQTMVNRVLFISGRSITPARSVPHRVWLRFAIGWWNSFGNTIRIVVHSNQLFTCRATRRPLFWERQGERRYWLRPKTGCQFSNIHPDESNNPPLVAAQLEKIKSRSWCALFSV